MSELIDRLNEEADLCQNEGATDIAALLWEAAKALSAQQGEAIAVLRREIGESTWFDHTPVRPGSKAHLELQASGEMDYCVVYAAPPAAAAPVVPEGMVPIIKAIKRYKAAVAELFRPLPGGVGCLAEGSPAHDPDVYEAFMELNNAGRMLSALVAKVEAAPAPHDPFKWRGYTIDDVREQSKNLAASMKDQFAEVLRGTDLKPAAPSAPAVPAGNAEECMAQIRNLTAALADRDARIKALEGEREWQPIETAPKDGTTVLLAKFGGKYGMADGHYDGGCWVWPFVKKEPTHWLPLNTLPTAPASGE